MSRLFDDGASEYLEIAQAIRTGAPFAVGCLFNKDDEDQVGCLFSIADGSEGNKYFSLLAHSTNNTISAVARENADLANAITSSGYTEGVWHHGCAIFAATNDTRALIDGGSKGTSAVNVSPSGMSHTAIGVRCESVNQFYMSGSIAELAVWDLSVWPGATASDRADNFEKILPSLAKGDTPLKYLLGLVAYWDLIRGINDRVGGFNMTPFNAPSVAAHPPIILPFGPRLEQSSKAILLSGTIAIQSGMTGALEVSRKLSGAVAIQSGVTGALEVSRKLSGLIEIQSVVSGLLTVQKENVRWSEGLFTFQGISYEIAAGESNKLFIYWDPNYMTIFRGTNDLQDVLNCNGWIMCIGESGVASPVFARKLIHGGIIQAGTITAEFAQIADAAITTAKIKDLAVETIKVRDNAITLMVAAYTAGQIDHNHLTTWREGQTLTIETTGASVMLIFSVQWSGNGDDGINLRIQRDNTDTVYQANMSSLAQYGNPFCASVVDDSPSAAEHRYDLDMQATSVGVGDPHLSMRHRAIVAKEVKK